MKQSTSHEHPYPLHAAIIMDGNGRWALQRNKSRSYVHRQGEAAVRSVVEAAPKLGIQTLTLYAFSSDNWNRPAPEVRTLLRLLTHYLIREIPNCVENGVRVNVIGRRDRLPGHVNRAIQRSESRTRLGQKLHLRIAVDYSSRDAILSAGRISGASDSRESFLSHLNRVIHSDPAAPQVDLLIRTGGEQRLSDFLLWECAYAELLFSTVLWPEFRSAHLAQAVTDYLGRERRFGQVVRPPRVYTQSPSIGEPCHVSETT